MILILMSFINVLMVNSQCITKDEMCKILHNTNNIYYDEIINECKCEEHYKTIKNNNNIECENMYDYCSKINDYSYYDNETMKCMCESGYFMANVKSDESFECILPDEFCKLYDEGGIYNYDSNSCKCKEGYQETYHSIAENGIQISNCRKTNKYCKINYGNYSRLINNNCECDEGYIKNEFNNTFECIENKNKLSDSATYTIILLFSVLLMII